ncbi:unnamed protein product [Rotaria sp. Silwood2]|nr:unnamed protein product [Rotaria sp. Silwood2]
MKSNQNKPNPFLYANKWSRLFHNWIEKLINISHKQGTIYLHNVYDILSKHESNKLSEKLENYWFDELKRYPNKPSLFRATVYTVGWTPLIIGLLFIPIKLAIISQPLLIIYLMDFFEPCSTISIQLVCLLAILSCLAALCHSFCHHRFYYLIEIFAMKMRVAYHGLIFRKVLRLSSNSLNAFSSGEITNTFSNDASQIELILNSLNYLWVIYTKRFLF